MIPILDRASGFIQQTLKINNGLPEVSNIACMSITLIDVFEKISPCKNLEYGHVSYVHDKSTYVGQSHVNVGWWLNLHGTSLFPIEAPTEGAWLHIAKNASDLTRQTNDAQEKRAIREIKNFMMPFVKASEFNIMDGFNHKDELKFKLPYIYCDVMNEVAKRAYGQQCVTTRPKEVEVQEIWTFNRSMRRVAGPRQTEAHLQRAQARQFNNFEDQLDSSRFTIEDSLLDIADLSLDDKTDSQELLNFIQAIFQRANTWAPNPNLNIILEDVVQLNNFNQFSCRFFGVTMADGMYLPNCFTLEQAENFLADFSETKKCYVIESVKKLWTPFQIPFAIDEISACLDTLGRTARSHNLNDISCWEEALEMLLFIIRKQQTSR